ncbi:MAG: hypothetical protein L3J89_02105 [Gammaproteobacteria bacterium]|nr:hypothetical protein [Gammaproteobacteria bacterium]
MDKLVELKRGDNDTSALLFLFYLCVCMNLMSCVQADTKNNKFLPIPLSDDLKEIYDSGQSLVLYSYRDEVVLSEAYADWEAYLNDFKQGTGKNYFYLKLASKGLEPIIYGATEFTLFLKKDYPVFLYDGFIVEPQVYTAIHRKFSQKSLTDIDRAFMPEEILQ